MTSDSYASSTSPRAMLPSLSRDLSAICATMLYVPEQLARLPKQTIGTLPVRVKFRMRSQRPGPSWLRKGTSFCLRWSPNALRVYVDTSPPRTPWRVSSGKPSNPAWGRYLPSAHTPTSPTPPLAPKDQGPPKESPVGLPQPHTPTISHPTAPEKAPEGMPASVGFTLFGKFVACRNGREILVNVFEALAERDPTFIEKFVARPRHGTKRRYLAVDPKGLHPADPRRARENAYTHQLKSGYWLLLQVDHYARVNMIKLACEVTEIGYGTDLRINNPPIRRRSRASRGTDA